MTARARARVAVLAGVGLLVAHAALAPALVRWTARPSLRVRTTGPAIVADPAAAGPAGVVEAGVATLEDDQGQAPGLVRHRWRTEYRGGIERAVGRVRLVGPLQDLAAPPCGGRLAVGQRLLDDGHAGPGTVAAVVARELTAALADVDNVAAGRFRRLTRLSLRWTTLTEQPFELGMFPTGSLRAPIPGGYLRATAVAEFARVSVPIVVGALPRIDGGQLGFAIGVRARLDFGNRVLDWVNAKLGGDRFVTRIARGQLDTSLLAALGPPPPLPLPGGRTLTVELCPDRPVDVVAGSHAAVPVRWRLGGRDHDPRVRPPRHGPIAWPPPDPATAITLDLDLDGLDALAYELWRTDYLDELLTRVDLPGRFARDPRVAELLSVRVGPPRLAFPPTFSAGPGDRLRLALALALDLRDPPLATPAMAWAQVDVGLGGLAAGPTPDASVISTDVTLAQLELTCSPEPELLTPCYADLIATIRDQGGAIPSNVAAQLGATLTALFVDRRLASDLAPAALAITSARARGLRVGDQVMARVELDGRLESP